MFDALIAAIESDLHCKWSEAGLLAGLARTALPEITGSSEDTPEDLVLRLRDPRMFGRFARIVVDRPGIPRASRILVAEHAFDLLPIPRAEGDVFLVGSRAPPELLELAAFLLREEAFTILHFMHLVYAIFLDRNLLTSIDRDLRSQVLLATLGEPEVSENLRVAYAALHLASVDDREAASLWTDLMRRPIPGSVKDALARLATEEDGGVAELARRLRDEGLLPSTAVEASDPVILANIPRLPPRLRPLAEAWLARDRSAADAP